MPAGRSASLPLPVLLLLLLAGCARPDVLTLGEPSPGAQRSPESVQLLLDAPTQPYRTIALIRSTRASLFKKVDALRNEVREEAARMGADAVILGLTEPGDTEGSGVASDGSVVFVSGSGRVRVIGRAIVFETPRAEPVDGGGVK